MRADDPVIVNGAHVVDTFSSWPDDPDARLRLRKAEGVGPVRFSRSAAALLAALLLLLASCGGGTSRPQLAATGTPASDKNVANNSPSTSTSSGEAPIGFAYKGLNADKTAILYTIKVNTSKRIEQVDLHVKETDASGKVLLEDTLIWQNIVKSTRQPIVAGQTYDVEDYLYPESVKAEVKLLRVVYEDLTTWEAPN